NYCVPENEMTLSLFETVLCHFDRNTQDSRMKVQGAMELLMSDFFVGTEIDRHNLVKFDRVLRFIDENYSREIRLSELAELMKISPMYFSNLFKQVFHISPKQYVLQKRLNEGQRLLLESDLSIKEIAYSVGFENENYFSEFFTSKVGVSPRKFRSRQIPKTMKSVL
ncbi:MAG: helix-turn-helix transcriptional regulator, partial [Clostridia bacterium]|nr:helix-turn-helix transcriptional regulator [Clostridia bacterium]